MLAKYSIVRSEMKNKLWTIANSTDLPDKEAFDHIADVSIGRIDPSLLRAQAYMDRLTDEVFNAYRFTFMLAPELTSGNITSKWTFPKSVFFSTTVITTIGK
jgi:hypothetical protein